jgi:hypothetical protein
MGLLTKGTTSMTELLTVQICEVNAIPFPGTTPIHR